jgi:hypothetical protein
LISSEDRGCTDPEEFSLPRRFCRFCQQSFEPSKFRPDQSACRQPDCQRRRRGEYHRRKVGTDPEYAEIVRDSRRKWREAHPDYQKTYRQSHQAAVARNRQLQGRRDSQRRLQFLVKNNLALDLKRCTAEAWLIGPGAGDLVKNNLAPCQMFIFQPVTPAEGAPPAS